MVENLGVALNITTRRMKMTPFILLILMVSEVSAGGHSLQYYRTAVSSPGSEVPAFFIVGYVDDQEIERYYSDTGQYLPTVEWMKRVEPEYWERETKYHQRAQQAFQDHFQSVTQQFKKTGGLHTYQEMYGCELRDDNSTAVYYKHGYNGGDFMYLDTKSWNWIPVMYEARYFTEAWNRQERTKSEEWKIFLMDTCIERLKKCFAYGREDLEKKVRPEVKVLSRYQSDDVTRLQCLVYGFHPRLVDVKWMRNGEDHLPSDETSPILPHPDGTYQIRVSVEVPSKEGDTYSCHVEHSSLGDETLRVIWDSSAKSKNNISVIIGICVAIAVKVITAVAIGVMAYRNRH